MITTCQCCGKVLEVPTGIQIGTLFAIPCTWCGRTQKHVGYPDLLKRVILTGTRAFAGLPDFPPRP